MMAKQKSLPRRVLICIDRSFTKYSGIFSKESSIINPRNYLELDEKLIDYNIDSEDEL